MDSPFHIFNFLLISVTYPSLLSGAAGEHMDCIVLVMFFFNLLLITPAFLFVIVFAGREEVCTVLFVIHILLRQGAPVCVFVVQTEAGSCLIKFCHLFIKSKKKKKPLCYFFEAC